ncbi:hypothetical protein DES53_108184 [Roseimicrobium gellanilyticum]|uniref:BNR repeat protein n=1 Tax=Roseimicrobium gellanilyticum TaxID=748857 RepID=A0A366HDM1_9BACT|nr:hypothetical protein [Roseimicrobium gellanilyticum]RBP40477.1 hypothetical protein DES53_108184 [Roseimicrobium gellanilyticum]
MRPLLSLSIACCLPLLISTGAFAEERSITLGELPLLFADDGGIATKSGVTRTIHPAKQSSSPVLQADKPWEGDRVYIHGSVYPDDATGGYRMWYLTRQEAIPDIKNIAVPGFRRNRYDVTLYATSRDGLTWEKPSLGLHAFAGSKENNIVFDLHSPSVLLDQHETDPAKRWKMLGYFGGDYYAAVSPDGLKWKSHPDKKPIFPEGDNISLAQDPITGEYLAYHRLHATLRGTSRRTVWLSRSKDFATWSKAELTFAPDEIDDAWVTEPKQRTEVNNMSVLTHAAGYLGFPTIFRVTAPDRKNLSPEGKPIPFPKGQSPTDGYIDVQLITSADGLHWQRTEPRIAIIARGKPGTFDAGTILGVSSTAVHVGDETWMYYTGLTTSHGGALPEKRNSIGRAVWRRHGFASLDAGEQTGTVQTIPLRHASPHLIINASTSNDGLVRIAVLEKHGAPIPGLSLDESNELRADATQWKASWKSGTAIPTDRPVRILVELKNARLYSLYAQAATEP